MKSAQIRISGNFEDAYLYMGWLHIIGSDRSLISYSLDGVTKEIDAKNKRSTSIGRMLFARNDWLVSQAGRSFLRNSAVRRSFLDVIDLFPKNYELSVEEGDRKITAAFPIRSSVILDILFYNKRMYVAANDGMSHIDFDTESVNIVGQPEKRHDAKCYSVSAKYGMINASCGSEGLYGFFDDFSESRPHVATRLKNKSLRTSWINSDLANYQTNGSMDLYRAMLETTERRRVEGEKIATQIFDYKSPVESFVVEEMQKHANAYADVQYAFDNKNMLFFYTYSGDFYSFRVIKDSWGELSLRFDKQKKSEHGRIISAHSLRSGVVIETEDKVFYYSRNRWHLLYTGRPISIRTYARSKRFQNLITIVHDEGLELISVFDEQDLPEIA